MEALLRAERRFGLRLAAVTGGVALVTTLAIHDARYMVAGGIDPQAAVALVDTLPEADFVTGGGSPGGYIGPRRRARPASFRRRPARPGNVRPADYAGPAAEEPPAGAAPQETAEESGPGTNPQLASLDPRTIPRVSGGPPISPTTGTPLTPVDPVTPVPEPATWATLILGLALIGGVLRRARRRPALA